MIQQLGHMARRVGRMVGMVGMLGVGGVIGLAASAQAVAGQATLTALPPPAPTVTPQNGCAYSLAMLSAETGALTITCDTSTAAIPLPTVTLTDLDPATALSCNYKAVDFAATGALTVACSRAPTCTLSTPPTFPADGVTANTEVILTAVCTGPAPISYAWSSNTTACNGTMCTVKPTSTTTYSVTGTNSDGSNTASVSVKVNSSATEKPVCTLTSYSGTTFTPGDEVLLTTNCSPAATSYVWTGGSCAGKTTPICSDYPKVATTYTVTARNDIGADSERKVTVTPSGTTPPPSTTTISCSLSASPSTPITPGTAVTLTASCTPGATSYVWTGGSCAGQTASSCTVTPATTTSYSVTGRNASATAAPKTVIVTVNTPDTTAPVCTLTSYSPTFTPGDEVLLTANCTPAATSWVWTGGGCAGKNTATCSDYPKVATTYTVKGTNNIGPSNVSTLEMKIATTSSLCSLTAIPPTVVVGEPYTLTGKCGDSMVVSAKWSGEGCTAATASSCTVTSTKAETFAYSVKFTLITGDTSPGGVPFTAATSVTVTAAATPDSPVCELTASPTTVAPGVSSTLTASCTPVATTYTWSDDSCLATSATCSVKPSADKVYTVKGKNAVGEEGSPATATVTVSSASSTYQGMWWNKDESGWGISLTQHSDKIFAAIYTYDDAKQPTWYVISDCPITANGCTGKMYKMTGGSAPLVEPWTKPSDPASVGTGTLTFTDTATGKFAYTLNGISREKAIQKFTFAGNTPPFAVVYTNLWMDTSEVGWGVALTQDNGNIFAAWYAYNTDGTPVWYTAQCALTGTATDSRCNGDLLRITGGVPLSSDWSINRAQAVQGDLTFKFTSPTQGEMVFAPNSGNRITKKITPFLF